ncbi:MAG: hypothetical protein ACYTGL_09700 [Planctomycetota bacterium]|jgi:hypothetical protein
MEDQSVEPQPRPRPKLLRIAVYGLLVVTVLGQTAVLALPDLTQSIALILPESLFPQPEIACRYAAEPCACPHRQKSDETSARPAEPLLADEEAAPASEPVTVAVVDEETAEHNRPQRSSNWPGPAPAESL